MEVEALVVSDTRGFFRRGKVLRKNPAPNDVSINIEYAGCCHSDYHTVKGEWASHYFYPIVPGHEIAGIVDAVGSNVTKYKVGDRVGVGCFVDSCRECENCKAGDEQYCTKGMIGTYNSQMSDEVAKAKGFPDGAKVTYGGYSQKVVVDENYVCRIPDSIDMKVAAPLLCAGITMYSPLNFYGAKAAGSKYKVGIVGLGGLGDMGVKISKAMGNDVTVISSSERKKEYTEKTLGVKYINSGRTSESLAKMAKEHFGEFDLIICTISSQFEVGPYLSLVKSSGKFCIVGAPPEDMKLPAFALIGRRIQFVGSCIGGIKETQEMLEFCGKHQLWPTAEHIKASEINRAYQELGTNAANKQRFVIDVKNTLVPGDWEVDVEPCKRQAKHTVNPLSTIHGAPDTAGKTYYPDRDVFE